MVSRPVDCCEDQDKISLQPNQYLIFNTRRDAIELFLGCAWHQVLKHILLNILQPGVVQWSKVGFQREYGCMPTAI